MSIVHLKKLFNENNYISQKISILTKLFLCDTLESQIQCVSQIPKKANINPYIIEKVGEPCNMAIDNIWTSTLYRKT